MGVVQKFPPLIMSETVKVSHEDLCGVAIVLTTHILEVAEKLADRIGIIAHGKLIAEGDLGQLRALGAGAGASLEDVFLDLTARGEAA